MANGVLVAVWHQHMCFLDSRQRKVEWRGERAEMCWTPGLAAREGRERRMGTDGGDWSCGERGELPTPGDTQTQETHRNNLG